MSDSKEPKFGKVEDILVSIIVDDEFATSSSNNDFNVDVFEALIDKIENIRAEKNYEWQSDINLGLMVAHLLTEVADWVAQDFQSRDFCDILLEGEDPDDPDRAKAAKLLINKMLNEKDIYHFQKRIRAKIIAWMTGSVYVICYWEKDVEEKDFKVKALNKAGKIVEVPQKFKRIKVDRFNYEVLDPRNVFTDNKYCYSARQKDYIFIRDEKSIDELRKDAESFGYFNLDILESRIEDGESKTSSETYNNTHPKEQKPLKTPFKRFDIIDRYGKIWAIVKEYDEYGNPSVIEPGYKEDGTVMENAELVEAIVTYAMPQQTSTLIRFQPTWAVDALGRPYRPIVRGICYVHPTKDEGLSDGKNLSELDTAANDTFNIGNDRVMLATMPVMRGKRSSLEDNPTIFFAPGNVMHLEDSRDIEEFRISDNIVGALNQLSYIKNTASELDSKWPTTMGGLPEFSSTTATAVSGAEGRTNRRGNLKSLTWTYTFDTEFYTTLLHMTYANAEEETLERILGPKLAYKFDPTTDYVFVPISANIEAEHSKMKKVSTWDQIMGRIVGLAQYKPQEVFEICAHIISEEATLLGGDYRKIAPILENMVKAPVAQQEKGPTQIADQSEEPTSNQNGVPMSQPEQYVRGM